MKKIIAILFAVIITELKGNYNNTNSSLYSFSATMGTNGTLNGTWVIAAIHVVVEDGSMS